MSLVSGETAVSLCWHGVAAATDLGEMSMLLCSDDRFEQVGSMLGQRGVPEVLCIGGEFVLLGSGERDKESAPSGKGTIPLG